MGTVVRRAGIDMVGDVPWGTHFCHFHETTDDLLDILIPCFEAGLEADALCVCVCSEPLTEADARAALAGQSRALGRYESAIGDRPMTALCTYPLARSSASELLDVARTHHSATACRHGSWAAIRWPQLERASDEIQRLSEGIEVRVADRTAHLQVINEDLRGEMSKREEADAPREAQSELAHVVRLTTLGELIASLAHELNPSR
jgi:C4-dicarboxylate-specific signal transduction histidine kinase